MGTRKEGERGSGFVAQSLRGSLKLEGQLLVQSGTSAQQSKHCPPQEPGPSATTATGLPQSWLRDWPAALQRQRCGRRRRAGSRAPAPEAMKAEYPERPPGGWPGDPTLQLCRRRARRGASFLCLVRPAVSGGPAFSGQVRGEVAGRGPETVQRSLSRPQGGLGSKRAGPGSGTARPCPGKLSDGLGPGQVRWNSETVHCVMR